MGIKPIVKRVALFSGFFTETTCSIPMGFSPLTIPLFDKTYIGKVIRSSSDVKRESQRGVIIR